MNINIPITYTGLTPALDSPVEIVSGQKNTVVAKFTFTEDWNAYTAKTAVFATRNAAYTALISADGAATVPESVLKRGEPTFSISVFGVREDDNGTLFRYNGKTLILRIVPGGETTSSGADAEEKDTAYEQLLMRLIAAEETLDETVQRAQLSAEAADAAAKTALSAAETADNAAFEANLAAGKTNAAIQNAETATSRASTAADAAVTAAENARDAADNANASAESATTAAAAANTSAAKANSAAERADTAAEQVETAVENAESATDAATTAAGTANTAAAKANTAADSANSAADSANTAAERADTAAENCEKLTDDMTALIVGRLVDKYGVKNALAMYIDANIAENTLTNICDEFFLNAAKNVSETYTSQFYNFDVSESTIGEKLEDNANLVCIPSTSLVAERDDYAALPLFACFDVDYTIDETTLDVVIHAIDGVYGDFTRTPTDSLVGVMQMNGWYRRTRDDVHKTVQYRAQYAEGFKPLPEAIRVDGSVRGFVVHAKYAAGFNADGKLSSVSGVQPATYRPGSVGSAVIGHDGQIAFWRKWGEQYSGSSLCDIAFIQLMLELKYAVLGSAQVMRGCCQYAGNYQATVGETGVTRILLSFSTAKYFVEGSSVSLGSTNNRAKATTYDVCDIVKVLSIEEVVVDGATYGAVNLATAVPFDTTTDTYIVTQPWQTGGTDNVLGNDGSPTSNTSGKEPCKIQGIEIMSGVGEIPGDTILYEDAEKYTVYLNRKASEIAVRGNGTNPVTVGTILKEESAAWKYIAELNWDANDQEGYMLTQTFDGSSTTGYRAACYRDGAAITGWRERLSLGSMTYEAIGGLACALLSAGRNNANWDMATRACGSAGNRGAWTPPKN